MNKNKIAICFSLYDNYHFSDNNIYYYIGIIEHMMYKNRDFDIYIDTTEYCKNILLKICEQENICLNDVYFNIHNNSEKSDGMSWRLYKTIDLIFSKKYEYVGLAEGDSLNKNSIYYTDIANRNTNHALYVRLNMTAHYRYIAGNMDRLLPGGCTVINTKNVKNIHKINNIINEIKKYKIIKEYGFDEQFLSSIFIDDIYNSKIQYISATKQSHNIKTIPEDIYYQASSYYDYIDIRTSKYFDNTTNMYILDNIPRIINIKPIQSTTDQIKQLSIEHMIKNKYIILLTQKYILGYINEYNLESYCDE